MEAYEIFKNVPQVLGKFATVRKSGELAKDKDAVANLAEWAGEAVLRYRKPQDEQRNPLAYEAR